MTEPSPEPPKVELIPTEPSEPDAEPEHQALVAVVEPFYVAEFSTGDDKLTIDRTGVLVPESAVPEIVASAGKAGIALKVSLQS